MHAFQHHFLSNNTKFKQTMKYEESIVDSVVEGFVFYNVEESQSHES